MGNILCRDRFFQVISSSVFVAAGVKYEQKRLLFRNSLSLVAGNALPAVHLTKKLITLETLQKAAIA